MHQFIPVQLHTFKSIIQFVSKFSPEVYTIPNKLHTQFHTFPGLNILSGFGFARKTFLEHWICGFGKILEYSI